MISAELEYFCALLKKEGADYLHLFAPFLKRLSLIELFAL